jgi:hypothetical protein
MNMNDPADKRKIVFWFALIAAKLSFVLFTLLVVAQVYVRWSFNRDFSFLGGFGLETLGVLSLGLILGLLRETR